MPAQNLTCPKCGRIYHPTFRKCPACGTAAPAPAAAARVQPVKCASCERPFSPSMTECPFCKAKAGSAPPPKQRFDYAAIAEKAAEHNRNILLMDFSPASVYALDVFFDEMWGTQGYAPNDDNWEATPGQVAVVMNFGCYFGEVMRRRWGGHWEEDPNQPNNPLWSAIVLPENDHVYAIAKVFKRLKNGSEDALQSIFTYARHARNDKPGPDELASWLAQAAHFEKVHRPDHALTFYDVALALPLGAEEKAPVEAARAKAEEAAKVMEAERTAKAKAKAEAEAEAAAKAKARAEASVAREMKRAAAPAPAAAPDRRPGTPVTGPQAGVVREEPPAPEPEEETPSALKRRAAELAQTGTLQEAVDAYTKLLGADPTDAEAWKERGVGLALLGDVAGALASLDKAIALEPRAPEGYDHKAVTLGRVQRWGEALTVLEAGLEAIPENPKLLRRKGIFLGKAGRPKEAIAVLDRAQALDPSNPDPLFFKAEDCRLLGEDAEAVELLQAYCGRVPAWTSKTAMEARRLLWSLQNPGRTLDAEKAAQHSSRAWQRLQKGDYDGALEAFGQALEVNPLSGEDWLNRGASLAHAGRFEEALASYDRALDLLGPESVVLRNKAGVLSTLGRPEEALACHDQVLARSPGDEESLRGKAALLGGLGRYDQALACLDAILARNPRHAEALARKADCLRLLRRYGEALAVCDAVIALEPKNMNHLLTKSAVLSGMGRADEALALQQKAFADETFAKAWEETNQRLLGFVKDKPKD